MDDMHSSPRSMALKKLIAELDDALGEESAPAAPPMSAHEMGETPGAEMEEEAAPDMTMPEGEDEESIKAKLMALLGE